MQHSPNAGQLLGDLCALDSDSALQRRLRHYARPQLLVIDEVGYLSYSILPSRPALAYAVARSGGPGGP